MRIDTGIVTRVGLPPGLRDDPEQASTAVGQGGSLVINSQLLEVRDREAGVVTLTDGTGDAGSLFIDVETLNVSNATIGTFTSEKEILQKLIFKQMISF
ncbi:MAG: hypothetical protein HC787_08150 [Nostocaceae cyanobacterium CSU_2_110]|nr:hypothetical protein [Nostocaceae cyanobacterium CSU_2_110]